ncbi:Lrp/AsnC family transcriptional regulator [Candidatus Woesearchaeota archaeon]|nr:Lrp/AsnC family transcriptional regulator [Candidatus Woesearchaeota archaeon]
MGMDYKDLRIIEILKGNSREPVKLIAKKTGMRPSTVHQRIQKLIKSRAIDKFTIKLDNKAVGENFIAFILVKGTTSNYINDMFLNKKNVKEVFGITGEYDVLVKLKFRDVDEFNSFIMNFRKELKGIDTTLTMVVTANIKEEL